MVQNDRSEEENYSDISVPAAIPRSTRLLNLVVALLNTRKFLSGEYIRRNITGYDQFTSKETFLRMFERDKDYLRSLGIPIEVGETFEDAHGMGYRINRSEYEIGELQLTRNEITAVATAATMWKSPAQIHHSQRALGKIRATGVDITQFEDTATLQYYSGILHQLGIYEEYLSTTLEAIEQKKKITFSYIKAGQNLPLQRIIEPWKIIVQNRQWYLIGFDCDRQDQRQFKFSRMHSSIVILNESIEHRTNAIMPAREIIIEEAVAARIWLAEGYGTALLTLWQEQGYIAQSTPGEFQGRPGNYWNIENLEEDINRGLILSLGENAVVISPVSLQQKIIHSLQKNLTIHGRASAISQ